MSGFGRGGKGGHGGRGTSSISALRKGMAAKKNQNQMVPKPGGSSRAVETNTSSSSLQLEETFQLSLAPQGASQFAMMIRLTPGLLDDLRRAEAQGGVSSMKFGAYPTGNLIKVGQEEFKFSSASEPGNLCDICEERVGEEDGQGVLAVVGSAWRKLSVQRTLSASEKDRVKKRSVEAEQQSKSRKAIVLDSSMKPEPTSGGEALGRRPPVKTKKEPPAKKRKVTPAVPPSSAKTKPPPAHTVPAQPVKDKTGAGFSSTFDEPVVAPTSTAPLAAVTHAASQPPQTQSVFVENLPLVEEITIGGSPQNNNVPKEREKPAAGTPEVKMLSGTLSMNELRNNIIVLLTENQRGLTLKAVEKALGNVAPEPARRNIEKILKSIASYHSPGKYILNPGVKPETVVKPSPGSSLPDAAAVDSPGSPVKVDRDGDRHRFDKEKEDAPGLEIERIDIGEATPSKSSSFDQPTQDEGAEHTGTPEGTERTGTPEVDITMSDVQVPSEDINVPKPAGSSGSGSSSSSSGSESDSDSDSDSSSGSGSDSGSSSDEDEHVDIVSDDERSRPKSSKHKTKADEDEAHKESEDIDIGDADDSCKLDAVVEKLTETISLEVEDIPCGDGLDEMDIAKASEDMQHRQDSERRNEILGAEIPQPSPDVPVSKAEKHRSPSGAEKHWSPSRAERHWSPSRAERHWSPPRGDKHWSPSRNQKYRSSDPPSKSGREAAHRTPKRAREEVETQTRTYDLPTSSAVEVPRHRTSPRHRVHRSQPDNRRNNEAADQGYKSIHVEPRAFERSTRDESRIIQKLDTRSDAEQLAKPSEERMDTELELGEFREPPSETVSRILPVKASTPDEVTRTRSIRESTPELAPRKDKSRSEAKGAGQSHAKKHDSGATKKPAEESITLTRKPVEAVGKAKRVPHKGGDAPSGSGRVEIEVKVKKNSSADAKSKDSSGDSIQSKSTEFFAPFEKDTPELKGPINSYEQYKEYCREYDEKYGVYIQLNALLEANRETFENFKRKLDLAKSSSDMTRFKSIEEQVTLKHRQCQKRHKRMHKTFLLLHSELKMMKVRVNDYIRTCT